MLIFVVFQGMMFISHIGFLLWGVSFGALVTIFQAAVTKQVETGKDVATSYNPVHLTLVLCLEVHWEA